MTWNSRWFPFIMFLMVAIFAVKNGITMILDKKFRIPFTYKSYKEGNMAVILGIVLIIIGIVAVIYMIAFVNSMILAH